MSLSGIKISELQAYGEGTEIALNPAADAIDIVVNIGNETFKANLNKLQNLSKLNVATDIVGGTVTTNKVDTSNLNCFETASITTITNNTINSIRGTFASGLTGNLVGNVEGNVTGNTTTANRLNTTRSFQIIGDVQSDIITNDLTNGIVFTNTQLLANTVDNTNVTADAEIQGTKIVPEFGAQNITATGTLQLSGTATGLPSILINNEGASTTCGQFIFRKSRGANSIGPVLNNDLLGEIYFTGRDSSNTLRNGARIAGLVTSDPTNTTVPTSLIFSTFATSLLERMRITSAGSVGINTTNPASKLDVFGDSEGAYVISASSPNGSGSIALLPDGTSGNTLRWGGGGTNASILKFVTTSNNEVARFQSFELRMANGLVRVPNTKGFYGLNTSGTADAYYIPNWSDNVTYLNHGASGFNLRNNAVSRMFITSSGLVGIGITNPSQVLEVGGYLRVRGLASNNNTYTSGGELAIKAVNSNNDPLISFHNQSGTRQGYLQFGDTFARIRCQVSGTVYFGSANSDDMVINASGNVGIGNTTPSYQLQLSKNSAAKPTSSTWTVASDIRLKENIVIADTARCLDIVKTLPLKRYTWKNNIYNEEQVGDRSKLGWIAQDVQQVFPKGVKEAPMTFSPTSLSADNVVIEDCLSLDTDQVYAAMYGAIQELIKRVELLETKL